MTTVPTPLTVRAAPPPRPAPDALRTDVAGFAGRAETGPTASAVAVTTVDDLERRFGPSGTPHGHLVDAVRGYLENGGEVAWVRRLEVDAPGGGYAQAARLLDAVPVALVVLPDLWDDLGPEAPRTAAAMARAADAGLDRMLLLDLPRLADDRDLEALADALRGPEARAVAVHHPWVTVEARPGGADGRLVTVPPSGHVAGVVSRTDRDLGPARGAGGLTLDGVVDVDDAGPALLDARVDVLGGGGRPGVRVLGARTLDRRPSGRFLAHRRLVHRLVRAMRAAAEPLVFEPLGPAVRAALLRAVRTVLLEAQRSGALAGQGEEGFAVVIGDEPGDADAGRVVCRIELVPADPVERVAIEVGVSLEGRVEVVEQ